MQPPPHWAHSCAQFPRVLKQQKRSMSAAASSLAAFVDETLHGKNRSRMPLVALTRLRRSRLSEWSAVFRAASGGDAEDGGVPHADAVWEMRPAWDESGCVGAVDADVAAPQARR
jgi:hypothetical protein